MSTLANWIEGARPRTLPAALSPVVAGSGVAWFYAAFDLGMALLAFVVALGLQIGVNFANDYSDGIRGTDAHRVGPMRLVGSGAATPKAVKSAAFVCFGIAGVAGIVLSVWAGMYWLIAVGAVCVLAAWYYTGGKKPYGYLGLGELFVFVFFGLVAVGGTALIMVGSIPWAALWAGCAVGFLACAILVANNLRDIMGDRASGKRTLATRLGDRGTRWFYVALLVAAGLSIAGVAVTTTPWALLGLAFAPVLVPSTIAALRGATGKALIGVLKATGIAELIAAVGLLIGLGID